MNVILVNESEDKALVKSRRVLSRYLPQIGSRTWAGLIAQEGLDELQTLLRQAASKNTSVACHRVASRSRLELLWVVGSRKHFDESGAFAYRTLQATVRGNSTVQSTQSAARQYLCALLRLAALFHDLGKASAAFAAKLKRGHGAEQLRHDVVSMLIVAQSLADARTDTDWLERLAEQPESACACASDEILVPENSGWLAPLRHALETDEDSPEAVLLTRGQLHDRLKATPGLAAVLWLVLTHHRLPEGTQSGEQLDAHTHINRDRPDAPTKFAPWRECLRLAPGVAPWKQPGWLESVKSAAQGALLALDTMKVQGDAFLGADPAPLALLMAHLMRPGLMQADHLAALLARDNGPVATAAKRAPLANLVGKGRAGDALHTHLLTVQRLARRMLGLALSAHRFPAVRLVADAPVPQTGLPERFAWQERLAAACSEASAHPTFVALVCETGAGKTRGGLRAAHVLSGGNLRLSLALSRRTLTVQTAQALLEQGRIARDDLAVVIGSPQALDLAKEAERAEKTHRWGSESAGSPGDDADTTFVAPQADTSFRAATQPPLLEQLGWLEGLCTPEEARRLWGAKTLNLVSAPVLACTADHLVRAVSLLRGRDAYAALRLTTSDLLLDEIDSYTPADLQSIGKLAMLAGIGGRHVIVMSATASPAVVQGLYAAWLAGLAARGLLELVPAHRAIFCAHVGEPVTVEAPSSEAFAAQWHRFVSNVCAVYANDDLSPPRRRAGMLALSECRSREEAFDRIVRGAWALHRDNFVVDPVTGKRYSIGYARFNTARSAWQCARHLAETGVDPHNGAFKVLAYHGKYPRTHLARLDAVLARLCMREDGADPAQQCGDLRQWLDSTPARDVLLLVCTTTLIETGRNFDFDWGILEPRSTLGEIQAVGRIRRHRMGAHTACNVLVLETPLNAIGASSEASLWRMPGIEDAMGPRERLTLLAPAHLGGNSRKSGVPARFVKTGDAAGSVRHVRFASEALPLAAWAHKMDARDCLLAVTDYASNRIGMHEQHFQARHLLAPTYGVEENGATPSLYWYCHSLAPLNRMHAARTLFRKQTGERALFLAPSDALPFVRFVDAQDGERRRAPCAAVVVLPEAAVGRIFVPDLAQRSAQLTDSDDANLIGTALRTGGGGPSHTVLTWCDQLGFLEGSARP